MQPLDGQRQLVESLQRAAIFAHLSADQLAAVARRSRAVTLAVGQPLFRRGSPADVFFLLVRGQLKLYRTSPDGNEVIVEVLEPGATFGETRVFLENPRFHLSCDALADSEVVGIEAENFRAVLSQSVETCPVLLRKPSGHAEDLVDEVERLALQNGTSRVAG